MSIGRGRSTQTTPSLPSVHRHPSHWDALLILCLQQWRGPPLAVPRHSAAPFYQRCCAGEARVQPTCPAKFPFPVRLPVPLSLALLSSSVEELGCARRPHRPPACPSLPLPLLHPTPHPRRLAGYVRSHHPTQQQQQLLIVLIKHIPPSHLALPTLPVGCWPPPHQHCVFDSERSCTPLPRLARLHTAQRRLPRFGERLHPQQMASCFFFQRPTHD